jgi:hypothetical protein
VDVDFVARIFPELCWDGRGRDSDVLVVGHGCSEEVVFDIESEMSSSFVRVGNGAVYVNLGVESRDSWRASVARVVEFVASRGHPDAMGFGFLWADCAYEIGVGNLSACWDLRFRNKKDGACSVDPFCRGACDTDPVWEETAPFVR